MADISRLMEMIDDWVDQDEDCGVRLTPVIAGEWSLQSISDLYQKTVRDQREMLDQNGIHNPLQQTLFVNLYQAYLHAAIDAMHSGVAA